MMLGTISKNRHDLALFSTTTPRWVVSEVVAGLGMPKSGAYAALATLAAIGLVPRLPQDKAIGGRSVEPSGVGVPVPARCRAVRKVLLASLGDAEADIVLDRHRHERRTSNIITSGVRLNDELDAVRVRGFGPDDEQGGQRICCVATPIRDRNGTVQAAISASVLAGQCGTHGGALRRGVRYSASAIFRGAHSGITRVGTR